MMKHKMQDTTKKGIKRKIEIASNVTKSKAPLKADLIVQHKELQEKFDDLEAANKKNLEIIQDLKEKIESLEKDKNIESKETQVDMGGELKCNECNFQATSDSEFSWHMAENHGWSHDQSQEDLDSSEGVRYCRRCDYEAQDRYELDGHIWTEHEEDEEGHVTCKFCSEKFATIANMMMHKKIKHREKIAICQNFIADGCPFEDKRCWFLHIESNETFKCNKCDKNFQTKSEFMQHRKKQHETMVQMCKNGPLCVFSHLCWFRHEMVEIIKSDENIENEKSKHKLVGKMKT